MASLGRPVLPGWLLILLLCLTHLPTHGQGPSVPRIRINEIHFHPASEKDAEEWVELLNTTDKPIDLSGWAFTRGIEWTFDSGTQIAAHGFVVVAADTAAFALLYPDAQPALGNWSGHLANSGQTLELQDAIGNQVDSVAYADQGDWAQRALEPKDRGHRGWGWVSASDGLGSTLELSQPGFPGDNGQIWGSSSVAGGTPGRPNSIATGNVAPVIEAVLHSPVIPLPGMSVLVTARLRDESTDLTARLYWRKDGASSFKTVAMRDDGTLGDAARDDGRFSATLPAHPDKTVIEFYIEATDDRGAVRTWPAPGLIDGKLSQTVNALYQVDGESLANPLIPTNLPLYRIVLTEADRAELAEINRNVGGSSQSKAQFNATFLAQDGSGASVRYGVGVRNRGNGSSLRQPQSFRVNFRHDQDWNNVAGLNLNSQFTPSQILGSALYRKLGLPAAGSRAVRIRVNGNTLSDRDQPTFGFYVANEIIDADYAQRLFPGDSAGNIYRGNRTSGRGADLHDEGELPEPYRINYFKRTNISQDDWTDLIRLCRLIGNTNAVTASWVESVRQHIDVEEWMLYFAAETIVDNRETNLGNANNGTGQGDDYLLYFGTKDTRARVIPYDLDTILGVGDASFDPRRGLFRMNANPWVARIMSQPAFAAVYYRTLQRLLDGPFAEGPMNAFLDEVLGDLRVETQLRTMKEFGVARRAALAQLIPRRLSLVSTNLPLLEGVYHASTTPVQLSGRANAATTFQVEIAGTPIVYNHMEAQWIAPAVALHPGLNSIEILARTETGAIAERLRIPVFLESTAVRTLEGSWTNTIDVGPTNGIVLIPSTLVLEPGSTLSLRPGTVLHFGTNAALVVRPGARLHAEGTASEPIQFRPWPGTTNSWGGVVIEGRGDASEPATELRHLRFEGAVPTALRTVQARVTLEDSDFASVQGIALEVLGGSIELQYSQFPPPFGGRPAVLLDSTQFPQQTHRIAECYFAAGNSPGASLELRRAGLPPNRGDVSLFDNVFAGGNSKAVQLNSSRAWLEGNVFLQYHGNSNAPPATAIELGGTQFGPSAATCFRNAFIQCDTAVLCRDAGAALLTQSTFVDVGRNASTDTTARGIVSVAPSIAPATHGRHIRIDASIAARCGPVALRGEAIDTALACTDSILSTPWAGPGTGNQVREAWLRHLPSPSEARFTSWSEAQQVWTWLAPRPGSPGIRIDTSGRDAGAVVPTGIAVSPIPPAINPATSVTFQAGPWFDASAMAPDLWPRGAGYVQYLWKLDEGEWSPPVDTTVPLILENLARGSHRLQFAGVRDNGTVEYSIADDSTRVGATVLEWITEPDATVPTPASRIRLNEIAAARDPKNPTRPDFIELYNPSTVAIALQGWSLAQSVEDPRRFVFPAGAVLQANSYLVVRSDSGPAVPGEFNTGFGLKDSGDTVYLLNPQGTVWDAVEFGLQLPGYTLGRIEASRMNRDREARDAALTWSLCLPTPGLPNTAQPLGDVHTLQFSEWLALPVVQFETDWIELQNPDGLPVDIGGLFFTDDARVQLPNFEPLPPTGLPARVPQGTRLPPHSYIQANATEVFQADGSGEKGGTHLNFQLAMDSGRIALYTTREDRPSLNEPWALDTLIDFVAYGPQYADVSQGRSEGARGLRYFAEPTPGFINPAVAGTNPPPVLPPALNEILAANRSLREPDGAFSDWIELYNPNLFALSLEGWRLTDDLEQPDRFVFPQGSRIEGRTRFVVRARSDSTVDERENFPAPSATPPVAPFQLNRNGGSVFLLEPASNGGALIDRLTYGLLPPDLTLGRVPDGTGPWLLCNPTEGNPNQSTSLGTPLELHINEWMANPDSGDDWFELYNPEADPVEISGFFLSDDPTDPAKHQIPVRSFVEAGGFALFHADDHPEQGANHVGFQLASRGEFLSIADADGVPFTSVSFGPQDTGVSEGFLPDGSKVRARFTGLNTPGASNLLDTDADGLPDAWEQAHGLAPTVPGDALLDADGDGAENLEEYLADTDPKNPADVLVLSMNMEGAEGLRAEFVAQAGVAYTVEVLEPLAGGNWTPQAGVDARSVQRKVRVPVFADQNLVRWVRVRVRTP
jgi:hypothetical protein